MSNDRRSLRLSAPRLQVPKGDLCSGQLPMNDGESEHSRKARRIQERDFFVIIRSTSWKIHTIQDLREVGRLVLFDQGRDLLQESVIQLPQTSSRSSTSQTHPRPCSLVPALRLDSPPCLSALAVALNFKHRQVVDLRREWSRGTICTHPQARETSAQATSSNQGAVDTTGNRPRARHRRAVHSGGPDRGRLCTPSFARAHLHGSDPGFQQMQNNQHAFSGAGKRSIMAQDFLGPPAATFSSSAVAFTEPGQSFSGEEDPVDQLLIQYHPQRANQQQTQPRNRKAVRECPCRSRRALVTPRRTLVLSSSGARVTLRCSCHLSMPVFMLLGCP